jgi:hypothetical protein
MNKITKIFLIVSLCWFIVIPVIVGIGFRLYGMHLKRPIFHGDHPAMLAACRTMIAERQSYHNDRQDSQSTLGDPVIIQPVRNSEVPTIIKNMNPAYIRIYKDHVLICFSALPRVYLLGFAEGAKQYGAIKLIDGLWYDGN